MNSLLKAVRFYRAKGFEFKIGLNPFRFNNYRDAPSAIVYDTSQKSLPPGGDGIAIAEVTFLETLFRVYHPGAVFGIGNGYGLSSILLSILNPEAKTRVIDCGFLGSENPDVGIELTNSIAAENQLNIEVVKGMSPEDVPGCIEKHFGDQKIDFVFIDGAHTNAHIIADFEVILPNLAPSSIILFHDVLNFNMMPGIEYLAKTHHYNFTILHRTESGMVVMYGDEPDSLISEVFELFSEKDWVIRDIHKKSHHYHRLQRLIPPVVFEWGVRTVNRLKRKLKAK